MAIAEESKEGEEEKKAGEEGEPKSPNPYDKSNLLMEKGGNVWLKDYDLIQARKEVKRPSALRSVSELNLVDVISSGAFLGNLADRKSHSLLSTRLSLKSEKSVFSR